MYTVTVTPLCIPIDLAHRQTLCKQGSISKFDIENQNLIHQMTPKINFKNTNTNNINII